MRTLLTVSLIVVTLTTFVGCAGMSETQQRTLTGGAMGVTSRNFSRARAESCNGPTVACRTQGEQDTRPGACVAREKGVGVRCCVTRSTSPEQEVEPHRRAQHAHG
jgi:hypothetical protein